MASAIESNVLSIITKLKTVSAIKSVERDRLESIDKSEGVIAVVEIDDESFEPFAGDCYTTRAHLRSIATVKVHLLSWSPTWAASLDSVACDAVKAIMTLASSIDDLRLTKREWAGRATDNGFGAVSLAFNLVSVCSSSDLSKKF